MTNRGLFLLFVGLALLGGALLAMNFPVYLNAWDQYGWQVSCGTGYAADLTQASNADLVDQCQSALAIRRAWTIPIAVMGGLILTGISIALYHHAAPRPETETATEESSSRSG